MKIYIFILLLLVLNACRWVETKEELKSKELKSMTAPVVEEKNYIHSDDYDSRRDSYQWMVTNPSNLLDTNKIDHSSIRQHIENENKYAEAKFHEFAGSTQEFLTEINKFTQKDNSSFHFKVGIYFYYYKYTETNDFPALHRYLEGEEEKAVMVIDIQKLAKNKRYFEIGDIKISGNSQYLAYAFDTIGNGTFGINILEINKNLTQRTNIQNSNGQIEWGINNKSIFFISKEPSRSDPIRTISQYKFHDSKNKETVIYKEKDPLSRLEMIKSKSNRFLFIYATKTNTTTTRFIDLSKGTNILLFRETENGVSYRLEHQENSFYIRTNSNSALNFMIFKTAVSDYKDATSWEEIVGHRGDILIKKISVFKNHIVLEEKVDGLIKFHILNSQTGMGHYADFPEETFSAKLFFNTNYESSSFIYQYSSLSTPETIYKYNMESRRNTVVRKSRYKELINPKKYKTERIWATSFDGTKVPISLIYSKRTKTNGTAPLLISCESTFGETMDLSFQPELITLLNKGFVIAIAHTRGGGYLGNAWHLAGVQNKKKNAIVDFISCTEYLVARGYVSRQKLFASGSKNNALVIAAAMNFEPNLFKGGIFSTPKVDLLTSLFQDNDNETNQKLEWGDPEDEDMYYYLKSYSPYDNIEKEKFPSILIINGLFDKSVPYWESLKWVAKLREHKTSQNKILIKTDFKSEYTFRQGRQKGIEDLALKYSFIYSLID